MKRIIERNDLPRSKLWGINRHSGESRNPETCFTGFPRNEVRGRLIKSGMTRRSKLRGIIPVEI
ncbi:MAG: hypothetical protein JXA35_06650, partial [Deltaproteobacteria bacterium]|nr:hypothetical protein [Deltaproteobacteria bacterium]